MAEQKSDDSSESNDPRAAFKAALERKNAQAKGGPGASTTGPGKAGGGSTKAAGAGRRSFQRKSGSA